MCDEYGIAVISEAPAVGLQSVNMVRETFYARRSSAITHSHPPSSSLLLHIHYRYARRYARTST